MRPPGAAFCAGVHDKGMPWRQIPIAGRLLRGAGEQGERAVPATHHHLVRVGMACSGEDLRLCAHAHRRRHALPVARIAVALCRPWQATHECLVMTVAGGQAAEAGRPGRPLHGRTSPPHRGTVLASVTGGGQAATRMKRQGGARDERQHMQRHRCRARATQGRPGGAGPGRGAPTAHGDAAPDAKSSRCSAAPSWDPTQKGPGAGAHTACRRHCRTQVRVGSSSRSTGGQWMCVTRCRTTSSTPACGARASARAARPKLPKSTYLVRPLQCVPPGPTALGRHAGGRVQAARMPAWQGAWQGLLGGPDAPRAHTTTYLGHARGGTQTCAAAGGGQGSIGWAVALPLT